MRFFVVARALGFFRCLFGGQLERFACGLLLRCAAAGASAGHPDIEFGNYAFHLEFLVMRSAVGGDDVVSGQCNLAALQILLQQGFGVLAKRLRIHRLHDRVIQLGDRGARGLKSAIQKNGTEQGFQRVGQNRGTAESAAFELAFAQFQEARQINPLRYFIQRLLFDQVGTQARQIAFVQFGIALIQQMRHGAIEHTVAEKLQAFVMRRAVAAVGQRLMQEFWR